MRRERRQPTRRKKRLSQADLRAAGATPGLVITRYSPNGGRAEVRSLTPEARKQRSARLSATERAETLIKLVRGGGHDVAE